jgi:hypothetical protein
MHRVQLPDGPPLLLIVAILAWQSLVVEEERMSWVGSVGSSQRLGRTGGNRENRGQVDMTGTTKGSQRVFLNEVVYYP